MLGNYRESLSNSFIPRIQKPRYSNNFEQVTGNEQLGRFAALCAIKMKKFA
jgi:hypothetical protein